MNKTEEKYISEEQMDADIERYNNAKANGTLDEEFPVLLKKGEIPTPGSYEAGREGCICPALGKGEIINLQCELHRNKFDRFIKEEKCSHCETDDKCPGEDFIGKVEEELYDKYHDNEFFSDDQLGEILAIVRKALQEQMKQVVEGIPDKVNCESLFDIGSEFATPKHYRYSGYNSFREELLSNLKERGLIQ